MTKTITAKRVTYGDVECMMAYAFTRIDYNRTLTSGHLNDRVKNIIGLDRIKYCSVSFTGNKSGRFTVITHVHEVFEGLFFGGKLSKLKRI